ncbi:potassium channel family protein [Chryseobacterium sp. VD8]|uniref:potassium channel family protein n=1 Tax=Chryseobacterium sp. VD8 TaxID=3081254 RepID=UPI00301AB658
MKYPTPSELWEMNPDDFNKWRRENDLKRLFECFRNTLPHFDEWLDSNGLTISFILETDKPGQFFYWNKETYCIKSQQDGFINYYFVPIYDKHHNKQILNLQNSNEEDEYFKFTPYFLWVKKEYKIEKPIKTKYSGDLNTFRYIEGTAPDVPDACNWSISAGTQGLKLGGVKINGWIEFLHRNLDFTNLDFLKIEGKESWSKENDIFYSHCANISINNAEATFTKFYQCSFDNLRVIDTRCYGLEFYQCEIFKAYFESSGISNIIIENCSVSGFSFNRVEVEELDYIPPMEEFHHGVSETYKSISENNKRFRILYQSNGIRKEASQAYYNERFFEMKYKWEDLKSSRLFSYLLKTKDLRYTVSSIKNIIQKTFNFIADLISYTIWGFGEKPGRIILSSFFVLTFYALIYFFSNINRLQYDVINSYYLSIVTFTTLGFGDITPLNNNSYKIIVGSEALLGAFFMGLLVAGYSNKSKY